MEWWSHKITKISDGDRDWSCTNNYRLREKSRQHNNWYSTASTMQFSNGQKLELSSCHWRTMQTFHRCYVAVPTQSVKPRTLIPVLASFDLERFLMNHKLQEPLATYLNTCSRHRDPLYTINFIYQPSLSWGLNINQFRYLDW